MSITPFGGPKTDSTRAIAVTGDGGAVVAGYFEDTAKFGAVEKTGAGKSDAFVAKLGADGAVAWVTSLGSPNEETAKAALNKAIQKLPIKARIITREETF